MQRPVPVIVAVADLIAVAASVPVVVAAADLIPVAATYDFNRTSYNSHFNRTGHKTISIVQRQQPTVLTTQYLT